MADFVAVLKKTIEGLTDKSPEMREKVYRKARDTVAAKLAAIDPPPSRIVVDRQTKALEDAIKAVEAGFVEKPAADDFESVLAGMESHRPPAPETRPVPAAPVAQPALPPADFSTPREPAPVPPQETASGAELEPVAAAVPPEQDDELVPVAVQRPEPRLALPLAGEAVVGPARRRVPMGLVAALVALLVIAAGGYGLWLNKDDLGSLIGMGGDTVAEGEQQPAAGAPAQQQASAPAASEPETPAGQPAGTEGAQPPAAGGEAQPAEAPKFTQRLMSDGKEVDEGPADGGQSVGEGTSMASATQLADNSTTGQTGAAAATPQQPAETQQAQTSDQALPVGQRAIFYEERTSLAEGTADNGSTVWTLVNESPGNDLPPEPAIRAEVNIPSKNVQLKMTIRRNADKTLPASHIIEMIFLGNFEGGGIESVLRVALKGSEAAPGNPLIGIPARITDGYFLIALSSSQAERNTNLELLLRQSWLDIPIVYKSGRRALVTLEKGVPGDKVFQEAIQAWQNASTSG
jgi:hypothetical protein